MTKRCMKKRSSSLVIVETQIKATGSSHLTPARTLTLKTVSIDKEVGKGNRHRFGSNGNGYSLHGKHTWVPQKVKNITATCSSDLTSAHTRRGNESQHFLEVSVIPGSALHECRQPGYRTAPMSAGGEWAQAGSMVRTHVLPVICNSTSEPGVTELSDTGTATP